MYTYIIIIVCTYVYMYDSKQFKYTRETWQMFLP